MANDRIKRIVDWRCMTNDRLRYHFYNRWPFNDLFFIPTITFLLLLLADQNPTIPILRSLAAQRSLFYDCWSSNDLFYGIVGQIQRSHF